MASRHGQLVQATLKYLTALGYEVFPVKNLATPHVKNGAVTGWSRGLLKPGVSDVCGCTDKGAFIAVEVKISPDKLRPDQEAFAISVQKRGGIFVEVRDTVDALIQAHQKGLL